MHHHYHHSFINHSHESAYDSPSFPSHEVRSWATCAIWTLLLPLLATPIIFRYDVALMSPIHSYFTFQQLEYMQPPSDEARRSGWPVHLVVIAS